MSGPSACGPRSRAWPEPQRVVVHLHRFEELSFAEIGRVLGISEGAAKLRAFRAYGQLRSAPRRSRLGGAVMTECERLPAEAPGLAALRPRRSRAPRRVVARERLPRVRQCAAGGRAAAAAHRGLRARAAARGRAERATRASSRSFGARPGGGRSRSIAAVLRLRAAVRRVRTRPLPVDGADWASPPCSGRWPSSSPRSRAGDRSSRRGGGAGRRRGGGSRLRGQAPLAASPGCTVSPPSSPRRRSVVGAVWLRSAGGPPRRRAPRWPPRPSPGRWRAMRRSRSPAEPRRRSRTCSPSTSGGSCSRRRPRAFSGEGRSARRREAGERRRADSSGSGAT